MKENHFKFMGSSTESFISNHKYIFNNYNDCYHHVRYCSTYCPQYVGI